MGIYAVIAVGVGAALGAWLRWGLSVLFNPILPNLPLGTLIANLVGAYLIGVAISVFSNYPTISLEMRLLIATGFLGGLTTFSTFSAETLMLFTQRQYAWAAAVIASHLLGSLLCTALGMATVSVVKKTVAA